MGFLVIGHRGASKYELENSISSIQHAINLGVHAVEVDIRATKDGKPIVIHDTRLRRVSGVFAKVMTMNSKDVKDVKLRNGEPIPFLEDIIPMIKGKTDLVLDVKVPGLENKIVNVLKKHSMVKNTIFSSFLPEVLRKVKRLCPGIRVALLSFRFNESVIETAKTIDCYSLHPRSKSISPSLIAYAHALGMKVYPWTEDRISRISEMMEIGIDGIITNYPDIIELTVKHMRSSKKHPLRFDSLFG